MPAVTQATGAIELGARSVSSLVTAANRMARGRQVLRPSDWEREVVRCRYEAWDSATGPARASALDAYCRLVAQARRAVGARALPEDRERVSAVLRLERRLLVGHRLTGPERARAQRAVTRSIADVAGRPLL